MVTFRTAAFALVAFGLLTAAPAMAEDYTEAQRAACTPDAFRLCGDQIFQGMAAVKACMIAKKAQLSTGCLATFPRRYARR